MTIDDAIKYFKKLRGWIIITPKGKPDFNSIRTSKLACKYDFMRQNTAVIYLRPDLINKEFKARLHGYRCVRCTVEVESDE